jgi:hypothetical protein
LSTLPAVAQKTWRQKDLDSRQSHSASCGWISFSALARVLLKYVPNTPIVAFAYLLGREGNHRY